MTWYNRMSTYFDDLFVNFVAFGILHILYVIQGVIVRKFAIKIIIVESND